MSIAILMNLGFAASGIATTGPSISGPGDLTTKFVGYCAYLRTNTPASGDLTTLVANDVGNMRTGSNSTDDINTAYDEYLT